MYDQPMCSRPSLVAMVFFAGTLLLTTGANAGEMEGSKPTLLGGSLAVAAPTGEFKDAAGIAAGGFMHVAKFLTPKVAVSGSFGLLYHIEKKDTQLTEFPLLAGLNFYIGEERGLVLFGQIGIVSLRSSVDLEIARLTESETKFGSQWGAGIAVGPGVIRGSILIPSLPDVSDGFNVMGSYELFIVER